LLERFLDDFFFAFFADFFFAFFFAAMVAPFNVDRLSGAAGPTDLLRTTNVRTRTLVRRFYA
jgi:hypothetical protein